MALDQDGFEILFKNNFKDLCRFANRYIKDTETAREIVQDAFVSLWEKRESIDINLNLRSYLMTSVKNKSLNYIRDNKKFIGLPEIENYDIESESFDHLESEELNEKIEAAISELPEKCRKIFTLSRYENLKYQEIAEKLQISVKTVEAQVSKALQHMRSKLSEYIK